MCELTDCSMSNAQLLQIMPYVHWSIVSRRAAEKSLMQCRQRMLLPGGVHMQACHTMPGNHLCMENGLLGLI